MNFDDTHDLLKAKMMATFLRNKVFVSEDMYVVFLDVMLLHT